MERNLYFVKAARLSRAIQLVRKDRSSSKDRLAFFEKQIAQSDSGQALRGDQPRPDFLAACALFVGVRGLFIRRRKHCVTVNAPRRDKYLTAYGCTATSTSRRLLNVLPVAVQELIEDALDHSAQSFCPQQRRRTEDEDLA